MEREFKELLEGLDDNLKALAKTAGKTNKSLLNNTKSSTMFNNLQKVLNRTMADYAKRLKKTKNYTHEIGDAFEETRKDLKNFKKSLMGMPSPIALVGKGLKFLKDATIGVSIALAKTALGLSDATKSIKGLEDLISLGLDDLSVVGPVFKQLSRDVDVNVDTFAQLAKTGATFGSSIIALRKAQEDAMMPLGKFVDLISANSVTLAKLFGTVDRGVPQLSGFVDNLRDVTMDEFGKFGLTLDETSKFLGTFLELERARGNTTRFTQTQLMDATRAYTKDLVILSKLTGENVDQLNEQNMQLAADGILQSQLAAMSTEDADTLRKGFLGLSPGIAQLGKDILTLGAPISETSRDLAAIGGGRFENAFRQFFENKDLVEFQNAIKTISADTMQNAEAFGDAGIVSGRFVQALNDIAASVGTAVERSEIEAELNAAGDNIGEALNLITGELERTKAELELVRFEPLAGSLFSPESMEGMKNLRKEFDRIRTESLAKLRDAIGKTVDFLMGRLGAQRDEDIKKKKFEDSAASIFSNYNDDRPNFSFDEGTYEAIPQREGSKGFRDFGSGTASILHGREAVVPENTVLGNTISLLEDIAKKTGAPADDRVQQELEKINAAMGIVQMNRPENNMQNTNKEMVDALNKLIAVNMATENNTRKTNNNLANITGSLV